jgi:hypothetical protein
MAKQSPLDLAREFVRTVDAFELVPGMMASYDLGKLAICRELIAQHDKLAAATAQRDELLRVLRHIAENCGDRDARNEAADAVVACNASIEEPIARAQSGQPAQRDDDGTASGGCAQ